MLEFRKTRNQSLQKSLIFILYYNINNMKMIYINYVEHTIVKLG